MYQLLGKSNPTDEMWQYDPEMWQSMMALKGMVRRGDDLAALSLSFTIVTPSGREDELVRGGAGIYSVD